MTVSASLLYEKCFGQNKEPMAGLRVMIADQNQNIDWQWQCRLQLTIHNWCTPNLALTLVHKWLDGMVWYGIALIFIKSCCNSRGQRANKRKKWNFTKCEQPVFAASGKPVWELWSWWLIVVVMSNEPNASRWPNQWSWSWSWSWLDLGLGLLSNALRYSAATQINKLIAPKSTGPPVLSIRFDSSRRFFCRDKKFTFKNTVQLSFNQNTSIMSPSRNTQR